ncbi:MAG: flagellar FliJ family protein [Pseudomonadota bacterium]
MARLAPLIRVRRRHVDDKQKILARLYEQLNALDIAAQNLKSRLAEEEALLAAQPELQIFTDFAGFSLRVRAELDHIADQSRKLEQRVDLARDELRDAFAELKKIEIIADAREAAVIKAILKKETEMYDEIGLNRAIRQQKEERR